MADDFLTVVITGLVYLCVVGLLVAIVLANAYAVVHAWRSGRIGWTIVLTVLFVTGGGIATAVYLIIHRDEPMPSAEVILEDPAFETAFVAVTPSREVR